MLPKQRAGVAQLIERRRLLLITIVIMVPFPPDLCAMASGRLRNCAVVCDAWCRIEGFVKDLQTHGTRGGDGAIRRCRRI